MKTFTISTLDTMAVPEKVGECILDMISGGPVEIEVKRPSKKREQEKKYHAMIGDIAKTVKIQGVKYSLEAWKALLVDGYEKERLDMGEPLSHPGRTIQSLDGQRNVTLRASTKDFRVKEGADFIEYLYSEGIDIGAKFSDPSMRHYEEIISR